jgi:hypothetical protein
MRYIRRFESREEPLDFKLLSGNWDFRVDTDVLNERSAMLAYDVFPELSEGLGELWPDDYDMSMVGTDKHKADAVSARYASRAMEVISRALVLSDDLYLLVRPRDIESVGREVGLDPYKDWFFQIRLTLDKARVLLARDDLEFLGLQLEYTRDKKPEITRHLMVLFLVDDEILLGSTVWRGGDLILLCDGLRGLGQCMERFDGYVFTEEDARSLGL